jgi:RND superfamily putative drug exporter
VGAAGLILAGTFASLTLAGNSILSQLGFAVSAGIVLAAFVVATFFTPSVSALIGRRAWWPGHGGDPGAGGTGPAPAVAAAHGGAGPADGPVDTGGGRGGAGESALRGPWASPVRPRRRRSGGPTRRR